MLFEVQIVPVGADPHISNAIADSVSIIESAGLRYQLTASGTLIEGDWEEVIPVLKRAHEQARRYAPHLITTIRVEDDPEATEQLTENVEHVRSKLRRSDAAEKRDSEVDKSSIESFPASDPPGFNARSS